VVPEGFLPGLSDGKKTLSPDSLERVKPKVSMAPANGRRSPLTLMVVVVELALFKAAAREIMSQRSSCEPSKRLEWEKKKLSRLLRASPLCRREAVSLSGGRTWEKNGKKIKR
jgi:hypothetical protein